MRDDGSAIVPSRVTGMAFGVLGVLLFSISLPATKAAVTDLGPWFVAFGRAVGAGALALAYLWVPGATRPTLAQWRRLVLVALGVVLGFPVFTSLALTTQTSAHGAVVIALLPAITAVFAVLRAGERPPVMFWLASGVGLLAVLGFIGLTGGVGGGFEVADLYLLAAVVLCGLGYAEGGALARELGGANTICWALLLSFPVTVPATVAVVLVAPPQATAAGWAGFGYATVISMFLGFFAWYAGLARGGVAKVGQIQLIQPVLTLGWGAVLLGEPITATAVLAALAILVCVAATQRARAGVHRSTVERPVVPEHASADSTAV
jgi:drug/metabolite transporter (DMT)-like permease